ncbi:hypothetical protein OnM2_085011 [Erysiphe neolycopersici]|uniref:EGF-like domain-containing protein n=1 Tax=Erysiphe neolycopersici TaxID=212602 RepID=A0A420HEX8_9PEZI|nr:hypothetical protein OnM2_085011 [Erysiphe neolycopersici]
MSDKQWQSSARSSGTLTIGSPSKTRQILGTTQPRPFLLSSDKTILDTRLQNRVKLKVPIGLVDQRNKRYVAKSEIPRPKQDTQLSLSTLRERERENIRRYQQKSKISMGEYVAPQKLNRPKYIPSPADTAKLHEKTPKYQNLRTSSARKIEEDAIFDLNIQNAQFSPSTSSNGTIPDFPVPSNIAPALRSLQISSSPAAKRAISSFYSRPSMILPNYEEIYSSRPSSYHTYASSAALPSTFRGSVEMHKNYRKSGSNTSSSSKSTDSNALKIETAREYSLLNINNVGMALTSNSDIELSKSKSIVATYEKKIGLSEVEFNSEGARSLSSSHINPEHNLNPRSERSKDLVYSNLEYPSTTLGPDLANKIKADDFEFANLSSNKSNHDDLFNSLPGDEKIRPSLSKFHQSFETQKSIKNRPKPLKQTDPQVRVAILSDLIRCTSKFIAQIDKRRESEKKALLNSDFNRTYTKKDIYYEQERDIINRPPIAHLKYGVNQDFLHEEMSSGNSFKFPKSAQKRNHCCGLPVITFVALISILVIIIAAAILIPLFLFVFHKESMISRAKDLELCASTKISQCHNGGSSFLLENDTCACICTNNFTGKTCTTSVNSSVCSSIVFSGQRTIIGSSVERLIVDAKKNFSIPLSTGLILSHFNKASLSCLAENALVTFNGKSFREDDDDADYEPTRMSSTSILKKSELLGNNHFVSNIENLISNMESISIVDYPDNSSNLPISTLDSTTTVFVTVTPIIIPIILPTSSSEDSSTTTVTVTIAPLMTPIVPTPSISYRPRQTTTQISQSTISNTFPPLISLPDPSFSTPSTPSATSTPLLPSIYVVNEVILDFARVVTLFILQNTDLTQSINAQTSFQKVFDNKFLSYPSVRNLTLSKTPQTITVDLLHLSVDLGDGAGIFGGTGATSKYTS